MNQPRRIPRTRIYCPDCRSTGEIEHPRMGKVRCPACTVRKLPRTDWRPMNAADKRRRDQEVLSQTLRPETFKLPSLPTPLLTTDRVLTRWGCDGSGMPSENPDAYRDSLPVPLDPRTFTEVNTIVRTSPDRVRRFAHDWYQSYNPAHVLKKNWGLSPRQLGRVRLDVVGCLKSKFLTSRHEDLVALVRFIPE